MWYSQAGQDEWVIEQHGDQPGYFVDVGAYDGIEHSNTYALEQLGWTGLCIEPAESPFADLSRYRVCHCVFGAISDHAGHVPFNGVAIGTGSDVICATLRSVLDLYEAPDVIDYLSIDVEGHELEVLAGMDFDCWHVRLITIEHNLYSDGTARKDAIHVCLTGHGFERVVEDVIAPGYGRYEDWYRHSVEGSQP